VLFCQNRLPVDYHGWCSGYKDTLPPCSWKIWIWSLCWVKQI